MSRPLEDKYLSHTGHRVMPALRPNLKAKFHKDPYTAKVFLSKPKPRDVPPMAHRPMVPQQSRLH